MEPRQTNSQEHSRPPSSPLCITIAPRPYIIPERVCKTLRPRDRDNERTSHSRKSTEKMKQLTATLAVTTLAICHVIASVQATAAGQPLEVEPQLVPGSFGRRYKGSVDTSHQVFHLLPLYCWLFFIFYLGGGKSEKHFS